MEEITINQELRRTLALRNISFNANYNNKLNCPSFCTVRLFDEKMYVQGELFEIILKDQKSTKSQSIGIARLQYRSTFGLNHVTAGVSYIDANMSRIDFVMFIQDLYKAKKVNWDNQPLAFLVFQYCSKAEIDSLVENCK